MSRLLRFRGFGPRAAALARHRGDVLRAARAAGLRDVRVFGSVSTGTDSEQSDIDLLVTADDGVSLMDLARLEVALTELLGYPVDVVADRALRPRIASRVLAEALPL